MDNTTATPLGQRPLDLGADLVVASGTKALTGHSDLLLGYVATRSAELLDAVTTWRTTTGAVPGRVRRLAGPPVAGHPRPAAGPADRERRGASPSCSPARSDVTGLRWPGLPDDPAYAGGVGADAPDAGGALVRPGRRRPGGAGSSSAARLVAAATSFGGLHTTADRRAQWGDDTAPGFVRLSCGVEDTADLVADIAAALDVAGPV